MLLLLLTLTLIVNAEERLCRTQLELGVPSIQQVTEPFDHSEGPVWDYRKQVLYFVDIHAGKVLSYDYKTKKVNSITLNGDVAVVIPAQKDENLLLVGLNRTLVGVEWDSKKELGAKKVLATVSQQFSKSRFNDGKADKRGRLWIGTMGYEESGSLIGINQGVLYQFTREALSDPLLMLAPVNVSNGLCWNSANDKFYFIDSPAKKVMEFDFDDETGTIRLNHTVFDMTEHSELSGVPDGMTIDEEDNLWVALWQGGVVIKVDPSDGKLLQKIALPAEYVTSVAWGGPDFGVLFVTTSRYNLTPEERKKQSAAGSVFAITGTGSKGVPANFGNVIDAPLKKHSGEP